MCASSRTRCSGRSCCADGDELGVAEFPQIAAQVSGFEVRLPALPASRIGRCRRARRGPRREPADLLRRDPTLLRLIDEKGDVRTLADIEEQAIRFALEHYRSHMTEMASKLGIGRSTLYRKLKELGLGRRRRQRRRRGLKRRFAPHLRNVRPLPARFAALFDTRTFEL